MGISLIDCKPISLVFEGEWVPYTRQTQNSWKAPNFKTSAAGRYEGWKEHIRTLFMANGYHKLPGLPLFEPVKLACKFYCHKMFTERDLSNCVKAIEDALNPKDTPPRGKKFCRTFERFAWDDDKQVRMYGDCVFYPCRLGEDRIEVDITPLFGREDGMISYIRGIPVEVDEEEGFVTVMTKSDYGFNVNLPNRVVSKIKLDVSEEERDRISLYVHPHIYGDNSMSFVFYGFETKEELRVFKDICSIQKMGPATAFRFMELPLVDLLSAVAAKDKNYLSKPKGIGPTTAEKVIKKLADKSYAMEISEGVFDEKKYEQLVSALAGLWNTPVTKVRKWVTDKKFDWSQSFQDLFRVASRLMMEESKK